MEPSSFVNHKASLFKLKQSSTLSAYLQDFECLSTRVTNLNQQSLLNCFLSGLWDEIQRELYLLKPQSLHDAMGMAKLVEDKYNTGHSSVPRFLFPLPSPITLTPIGQRLPTLPIKLLTPAEMAARREKGLCFNCDSKFVPGHKFKPATTNV